MDLKWGGIVSVVALLVLPAVKLVTEALCIVLSAKIFRLPSRSFPKAIAGSLLVLVLSIGATAGLSRVLSEDPWLPAFIISLLAGAAVVSRLYRSSYVAGLGTLVLSSFLSVLVTVFVLGPAWLLGVGLLDVVAVQLRPPGLPERIQPPEIALEGMAPENRNTPTAF